MFGDDIEIAIGDGVKVVRWDKLKDYLPHRWVALMIDVVVFDPSRPNEIIALRRLEKDDQEFEGHFPDNPIFPGHCLDECFNLAAAALILVGREGAVSGYPIIRGKEFVKYGGMARPGDTLVIHIKLKQERNNAIFIFDGSMVNQKGEEIASYGKVTGVAVMPVK